MKSKIIAGSACPSFAKAAAFGLALAFTLSCSDLPDFEEAPAGSNSSVKSSSSSLDDNDNDSSSSVKNGSSSSRSSSSVTSGSSSSRSSSSVTSGSSSSSSNSSVVNSSSAGLCADFVDGTPRQHYGRSKAQFCDSRDGKKYVYTTIGSQTWMAENLNYNASGSLCYGKNSSNCTTYGRLYNWTTATTACPAGWHLPNATEWETMLYSVDPRACGLALEDYENYEYCFYAGNALKTESGWADNDDGEDGNGYDEVGFSALPGGVGDSDDGLFEGLGIMGFWWGSDRWRSPNNGSFNYETFASNIGGIVFYGYDDNNSYLYSVRCVKNN